MLDRWREVWRLRVRPRWRELRPLSILTAALAVIVLGTVGFMQLYPSFTIFDAVYNAVQLLGFGGALTQDLPWELEVARLLGPLLTGYAAARGVVALSREQLTVLAFRVLLRDHTVVAGLGDVGFTLVVRMYQAGGRVVAIEKDATNPAVEGCRERGISVLIGDATDPTLLAKARVGQATVLFATCGDDGVNADVAAAAAVLARARVRGALTAFAHIADPGLLSALEAWALREQSSSGFRLETFNAQDAAVRVLMVEHPPFPDGTRPAALVAGDGSFAEAIVLGAAREWHRSGSRGRVLITLAGPSADDAVGRLEKRHPMLRKICDLDPVVVEPSDVPIELADRVGDYSSIYVAFDDEAANLTAAITLANRTGNAGQPIVALVRDEDAGVAAIAAGAAEETRTRIVAFGVLTRGVTPSLVLNGRTETLARAMHEGYRRTQLEAGGEAADNPSLAPWADLPESLRESNRAFAAGIGEKLRAVGAVAVPVPLTGADRTADWIDGHDLERLARMEHERWAADLRREGWRHGPARDPELRTHPSLVEYDDLSESERDKDRNAVRELPAILAAAGFELRRPIG